MPSEAWLHLLTSPADCFTCWVPQLFFVGAGSLLPRISSIIAGADYSAEAIMEVLQAPDGASYTLRGCPSVRSPPFPACRSALTLGELVASAGGARLVAVSDKGGSLAQCRIRVRLSMETEAADLRTRWAAGRADGSKGKDATSRVFGATTAKK